MNKRLVILAGILSIALIILAVFYFTSNGFRSEVETVSGQIEKVNLESDQLPSVFPKDIPIEAGSETKQNYEAKAKDGRKQSTFSTTTTKTLTETVKVYQDFFLDKGWTKLSEPEPNTEIMRITLKKDNDFLTIEAKKGFEGESNIVDITLIESPK